jgi:hypothetical protein
MISLNLGVNRPESTRSVLSVLDSEIPTPGCAIAGVDLDGRRVDMGNR